MRLAILKKWGDLRIHPIWNSSHQAPWNLRSLRRQMQSLQERDRKWKAHVERFLMTNSHWALAEEFQKKVRCKLWFGWLSSFQFCFHFFSLLSLSFCFHLFPVFSLAVRTNALRLWRVEQVVQWHLIRPKGPEILFVCMLYIPCDLEYGFVSIDFSFWSAKERRSHYSWTPWANLIFSPDSWKL